MAFKKLAESFAKNRERDRKEAEALEKATSIPALEATPVDRMRDWTTEVGVLYGTPAKTASGWGIRVYPTAQQEALLNNELERRYNDGDYHADCLRERPAVSIDKTGRARALTITDGSRGFHYDMYGNTEVVCDAAPRNPDRDDTRSREPGRAGAASQAESMPGFRTGHVNPTPPRAPSPARDYAAAQDRQRSAPSRTM